MKVLAQCSAMAIPSVRCVVGASVAPDCRSFAGSRVPIKSTPSLSTRKRATVRTMVLFGGSKAVPASLYDIPIKLIDGQAASMADYKGKV